MYAYIFIDPISVSWRLESPNDHTGGWPHHGNPNKTLPTVLDHLREYFGVDKYDIRNDIPTAQPIQPVLNQDLSWLAVEIGINPAEHPSNKALAGAIRQQYMRKTHESAN